jgi:MFS transporter, DHA1 family, multidrug resistance protein
MRAVIRTNFNTLKPPVYSALAMAFAGIGDAFLYPFLPLYSTSIGIPVAWVGILLSINRFARVFLSSVVLKGFRFFGIKNITILASILAVCSTVGYGLNLGIVVWILLRIIWGLCFSAFRISTATYALANTQKGLALGLSNGIYEIGPLLALLIGPFIMVCFDIRNSFYILSAASSISLFFAYKIPALPQIVARREKTTINFPSITNLLSFSTSFIVEGILVISIGFFIQKYYKISILEVASIAGTFLFFRRICLLVISPLGGLLIDRFGLRTVLIISVLVVNIGVILIVNNQLLAGSIMVFGFTAVTNVILPIAASLNATNKISTIAQNSIFRDAGAAFGTLLGGFLLTGLHLNGFLISAVVVQAFLLFYWSKTVKLL